MFLPLGRRIVAAQQYIQFPGEVQLTENPCFVGFGSKPLSAGTDNRHTPLRRHHFRLGRQIELPYRAALPGADENLGIRFRRPVPAWIHTLGIVVSRRHL